MGSRGARRIDPPAGAAGRLRACDLLADLPAPARDRWIRRLSWWELAGGDHLFHTDDDADAAYVVLTGRLEVFVDERRLVVRGPLDLVGEAGLLDGGRRTASVRAVRDTILARLEADDLVELVATERGAGLAVTRRLALRAAEPSPANERPSPPRLVALIAASDAADVEDLAHRIAEGGGNAGVVSSRVLREWIAGGDAAERLARAEDEHELVLLPLGPTDDDVAALACRQVDLVLAVGRVGRQPFPAVHDLLVPAGRPCQLLLRRSTGAPSTSGWRRWTHGVATGSVLHVRDDAPDDAARVARRLTGRALGLVLGGGGARGFAHLGALRALTEAGIVVDRVGGSSMGAIIGAQVATGAPPDDLLDRNRSAWSRRFLLEPSIAGVSVASGRRVHRLLCQLVGDATIDELPMDFFCTTADLTTASLHVADRGPVADWVAASGAVPGLWPPFVDADGHLHADGGLLDNVPTATMAERLAGPIIAVDVCARQAPMLARPAPGGVGTLSPLTDRRRAAPPGDHRAPSLLDVVNRGNLLASMQSWNRASDLADAYLTPDTAPHGFGSFDRVAELAELGYRSTRAQLDAGALDGIAT